MTGGGQEHAVKAVGTLPDQHDDLLGNEDAIYE